MGFSTKVCGCVFLKRFFVIVALLTGTCNLTTEAPQTFIRHLLFSKDEFHYLNAPIAGTLTVKDDFECTIKCLHNPVCVSFNAAASKGPDGNIWCELLSSDIKHRNAEDYQGNSSSHHFSEMVRFRLFLYFPQKYNKEKSSKILISWYKLKNRFH